jgi:hypothetical protein
MQYSRQYKFAQNWFKENFGSELRNHQIRYFIISNPSTTKDEIINCFCNINCVCEISYPEHNIRNIKIKYLENRGDFYKCGEIVFIYEYYILHKTIPTEDQLTDMIRNTVAFETNPEEYHQKDKVHVPTLNLHKLSPIIKDTYVDEVCSLCQNEIGNNAFFKLPPCKHLFHASKEHCLEDSCILDWLQSHTQCPNCKTKVQIDE